MSRYWFQIFFFAVVMLGLSAVSAGSSSKAALPGPDPLPPSIEKVYFSADECGWAKRGSCDCEDILH